MIYTTKKEASFMKDAVAIDDMILTKDTPTTAGSKMLGGYTSLFDATVYEKLVEDYEVLGKVSVSEFGRGMLAESAATALDEKEIMAVVGLETNGAYVRAAALSGKVFVKPTYATVSRFGLIPVACSGDTVGVMADKAGACKEVLSVIACHDDKDGTSLPQSMIEKAKEVKEIKKVALVKEFVANLSSEMKDTLDKAVAKAKAKGVEVVEIDGGVLCQAKAAWAILSSAEFCNNVSKYDGVKYGYRAKGCHTIEDIYVKSRSEAFSADTKTAILYGSHVLSSDKYDDTYDKALRVRRLIKEYLDEALSTVDAILLPACSQKVAADADSVAVYEETFYTAPASITGLPVVVCEGVQWLGKAFAEGSLLAFAKQLA